MTLCVSQSGLTSLYFLLPLWIASGSTRGSSSVCASGSTRGSSGRSGWASTLTMREGGPDSRVSETQGLTLYQPRRTDRGSRYGQGCRSGVFSLTTLDTVSRKFDTVGSFYDERRKRRLGLQCYQ